MRTYRFFLFLSCLLLHSALPSFWRLPLCGKCLLRAPWTFTLCTFPLNLHIVLRTPCPWTFTFCTSLFPLSHSSYFIVDMNIFIDVKDLTWGPIIYTSFFLSIFSIDLFFIATSTFDHLFFRIRKEFKITASCIFSLLHLYIVQRTMEIVLRNFIFSFNDIKIILHWMHCTSSSTCTNSCLLTWLMNNIWSLIITSTYISNINIPASISDK